MDLAATVTAIVLAVGVTGSAAATLARHPKLVTVVTGVGFRAQRMWLLGVLKLAAGVGLLLGLVYRPIGVAAALGLIAYFCGAVWFHVRARNYDLAPPGMYLALSAATAALLVATAS
ncbi:MAG TPA: DoxX family protein [Aldersonia sp.]